MFAIPPTLILHLPKFFLYVNQPLPTHFHHMRIYPMIVDISAGVVAIADTRKPGRVW